MFPNWTSSRMRLAAIIGLALALRIGLFVGYANVDPWDDTIYLDLAHRVSPTTSGSETHLPVLPAVNFTARRGTYVPIAASQALLGPFEWVSSLPSLLASVGTLLFIYFIGCRLVGEKVALWGALFFAFAPLDLVYSTRILGDTLLSFWVTASVWSALEAARGIHGRGRRLLLYASSGICLFIACWTRLSGLLGLPLVLAAVLPAFEHRKKRWEPLLAGMAPLVAFLVQGLHNLYLNRSFGFVFEIERANSLAMFRSLPDAVFRPFSWLNIHCSYEEGVPHHFFKLFLGIVDHYDGIQLFSSYAFFGAVALTLALSRRRLWMLCFWVLFVFLFYQYGFRALTWDGSLHYYLVAHRPRYLHLLLPALCLLLGYMLVWLNARNRILAGCLSAALILPAFYQSVRNYEFYRGSLEDLRAAAEFLESAATSSIYSDPWGVAQLRFFGGRGLPKIQVLEDGVTPEPGARIVLGGSRGYELSSRTISKLLPAPFAEVHLDLNRRPPDWKIVFQRRGPHHVARRTDLVVLQVSPPPE